VGRGNTVTEEIKRSKKKAENYEKKGGTPSKQDFDRWKKTTRETFKHWGN